MLFVDSTEYNENHLVFLCDRRTMYDHRLGGSAVWRAASLGNKILGKKEWLNTVRIAAYDPERKTSSEGRAAKRDEIRAILAKLKPRVCVVMASRRKDSKQRVVGFHDEEGEVDATKGTLCWDALNPPAGIEQMAGTFWECDGTLFMAMQNPYNMEYVFNWQISNHLQRAWRVATGREDMLRAKGSNFDSLEFQDLAHEFMTETPIAVDIETIPSTETITMIGVSNGQHTVSLPWDAYGLFGRDGNEHGASNAERAFIRHVLSTDTPKIFHNAEYDIPFLSRRGLQVNGPIIDTMLLHGVIYKQFRHGLQACVAQEFAVPPWKTLFGLGRDRSPDPRVWAMRQHELRKYNEQDTYYTWHLARALAPKAGLVIEGMT
jgi:hypothetical protein